MTQGALSRVCEVCRTVAPLPRIFVSIAASGSISRPGVIARRARNWWGFAIVCFRVVVRAATYEISVEDHVFIPDQLLIGVGDTVQWKANANDHTVTSDDGVFDSLAIWDTLPLFQRFTFTFQEPGRYPYHCDAHGGPGGSGMSGTIIVSRSNINQAPKAPLNLSPANGAGDEASTPLLQASPFSDPDAVDFHAASEWIVRRVADNFVVLDTGEDTSNKTNIVVYNGLLNFGTAYKWQVRYKDGHGAWGEYSSATTFTTLRPVTAQGIGLKASYNNVSDFAAPLVVTTNTTINFDWGAQRPNRRITADSFAVRWEGSVLPEFTERYEFQFQYRGRARVWVKDQLLIDEWKGCSFSQARRGGINLVGGQLTAVRVEYAADPAGALAILRWGSPSLPLEVPPTLRLFPPAP